MHIYIRMYMYMCTHIHICVYMCICMHIHIHIQTYMLAYMYSSMSVSACFFMNVFGKLRSPPEEDGRLLSLDRLWAAIRARPEALSYPTKGIAKYSKV